MNFARLRIRLIMAFMLVSLVPLASLGYKLISQGETLIKERASSYLNGLSKQNAGAIREFMLERVNDLKHLSGMICLLDPETAVLAAHLEKMKDRVQPYLGFFGVDRAAAVFFTRNPAMDPLQDQQAVTHTWMGASFTDIFAFPFGQEKIPALVICTPIAAAPEKNCTRLCAVIDFRFVDVLLRKSNIEDTGEVYLVDDTGRFLSASRFGARALADTIAIDLSDGRAHGLHEIRDYRGEQVLQAYQRVDTFPWYVMADQDMAEILNRIRNLGREAIIYGLLTALVVFGLALFISTVIVNILKAKYQYEKELEFQVIQKEKLASLGLLTSGLAHELNTPLANALLYTQIAKEELSESGDEKVHQRLATVIDEVRRGSTIIRNLLDFSRHSQKDDSTTDSNKIVAKLLDITRPHCGAKDIRVTAELEPAIPFVKADASTFQAILTNLVANAVEAMEKGGVLTVKTRYIPAVKKIKIEVADSGPGIAPEKLNKIFDPFFTTKKPGDGIGLGLFVSYEMARKLGGDIRVISATREQAKKPGTVFTLELPAAQDVL
ncbi:MAG: ATP-binding protein [Desulfotignum sp.]|jgi:signal transduction histidine kinase|nr:ATP-binding protein [Desulfotignum sp.]